MSILFFFRIENINISFLFKNRGTENDGAKKLDKNVVFSTNI